MNEVFIASLAQVSNQTPLTDEWFFNPAISEGDAFFCKEPSVKEYVSPVEARRMSKVLKRTLATSLYALKEAEIDIPDAVITGTGMGCIENSEKFLVDISKYDEEMLKPTLFMQSTHNTISSLISIRLKCHGYNNTYSQKGISFESALLDAWLQLKSGSCKSVLLGCHDELTPTLSNVMKYSHPEFEHPSESSMACVLKSENGDGRCLAKVEWVKIFSNIDISTLVHIIEESGCDCVITGMNGNELNDTPYSRIFNEIKSKPNVLGYRHLLGDGFSASSMAFYCGVKILEYGRIPAWMYISEGQNDIMERNRPMNVLLLNHDYDYSWGLTKLTRV